MIEPDHLTHFWGPAGMSAPVEASRSTHGRAGSFETVMVNDADGSEYPSQAIYVEVDGARAAGSGQRRIAG